MSHCVKLHHLAFYHIILHHVVSSCRVSSVIELHRVPLTSNRLHGRRATPLSLTDWAQSLKCLSRPEAQGFTHLLVGSAQRSTDLHDITIFFCGRHDEHQCKTFALFACWRLCVCVCVCVPHFRSFFIRNIQLSTVPLPLTTGWKAARWPQKHSGTRPIQAARQSPIRKQLWILRIRQPLLSKASC